MTHINHFNLPTPQPIKPTTKRKRTTKKKLKPSYSKETLEEAERVMRSYSKKKPIPPLFLLPPETTHSPIQNIFQTLAGIIAYIIMILLIVLAIISLIPTPTT